MTYTTRNGVRYPDLMLEEPETAPGKYGLLRLRYLEKSDPGQLNTLLLEGALNSHLAQIDRQVRGQVEQTMERLVQRTKLPDKQTDPLGWAGTMNSLRQQAEETAMERVNNLFAQQNSISRSLLSLLRSGDMSSVINKILGDIMQHYPYAFDEKRVRGWIEKNQERYQIFGS